MIAMILYLKCISSWIVSSLRNRAYKRLANFRQNMQKTGYLWVYRWLCVRKTEMGPAKYIQRRFYTPYEVAQHNSPDDCWVSFLGSVYNLTSLIKVRNTLTCSTFDIPKFLSLYFSWQNNPGILSAPLIKAAGQDISNWQVPRSTC
jgi:hypothetical protein